MREIKSMDIIQIDVTNVCDMSCSNCTRFCGHYNKDKIYYMDLDYYKNAVISLKDFPGMIGMIGGEPTLHPKFTELCDILNKYIPEKERKGLWSNTGKMFYKHKQLIDETFGFLNLNDHKKNQILHTPILVASEDLILSGKITENEWVEYTTKCWVQACWSATITPEGAYFCEVAGMLDYLFEGNIGWNIINTPDWWQKTISEYSIQIEWACRKCGCQLPLRPRRCIEILDDVSPANLERLLKVKSPKIFQNKYVLYTAGLYIDQKRDNTWYWNLPNSIILKIIYNVSRYIKNCF